MTSYHFFLYEVYISRPLHLHRLPVFVVQRQHEVEEITFS